MLDDSITVLKGVGSTRSRLFAQLGVHTVRDLLFYFPRTYEDRSVFKTIFELLDSETVCVKATVFSAVTEKRIRAGLTLYQAQISDGTGYMTVSWFNNRFIKSMLKRGEMYSFYGKVRFVGNNKVMDNPVFERITAENSVTGKIVPIYPLCANMTQRILQLTIHSALPAVAELSETLPDQLLSDYQLCSLSDAIRHIHFPPDFAAYEAARRRLVFEEFFTLMLSLSMLKKKRRLHHAAAMRDTACADAFISSLPYPLTGAQQRVIDQILADIGQDVPMNRLVQGDVGSGKTVVAAAAMYVAAKNGYQAALMAPTEILARQHYENFSAMFAGKLNVCLLTGSMNQAQKKQVYREIAEGSVQLIIGTHALIQKDVVFHNLALAVTDEQHRFGVSQRTSIEQKGRCVHVLVMSATPIPRTLALILYGDLDVSIIDELPPGRKKVETYCVGESMRTRIYRFLAKQVEAGRQVYIVCPLIEQTATSEYEERESKASLQNVMDYTRNLQTKVFPGLSIGLMHGRLTPAQKDAVMADFVSGRLSILVSTTVIEVGVDVKNANTILIENAERFGLSALHQLRGRVGRGSYQSYCILICQSDSALSKKRMQTMCASNDGFYISSQDLKLRGPGDFFGTRQHGLPDFRIANLFTDLDILKEAQQAASQLLQRDAALNMAENAALREKTDAMLRELSL